MQVVINPKPNSAPDALLMALIIRVEDTGHGKWLGEGMKRRTPSNLPRSDVGQHKAQLIQ